MIRLSCVIPAYNEAPRIGAVLAAACDTAGIDEVILVDDGSTDATAAIAETYALRVAHLKVIRMGANGGKTKAVVAGLMAARGKFLILIDSDLTGLTPGHLTALASPVLSGRAGASLSLRANAPRAWRAIGLDYISGERVMPRALLADRLTELERLPRFGLEVFMNRLWLAEGLGIAVVDWPDVASPMKAEKQGGLKGVLADVAMMRDIFKTIPPREALGQIRTLRARRV